MEEGLENVAVEENVAVMETEAALESVATETVGAALSAQDDNRQEAKRGTMVNSVIGDIAVEKLVPFRGRSAQRYQGQRLEQLERDIEKLGLLTPIIVRPVAGDKYEIICGHNRVEAVKGLGHTEIRADVRSELSDAEALGMFYGSNLNQQSFSDWKFSQKIEAIIYLDELTKENSKQGERNDLNTKSPKETDNQTSVRNRQKSQGGSATNSTRSRMARQLGIATATFSKYRSIIKLDKAIVDKLAVVVDDGNLSLDAVYRISQLKPGEVEMVIGFLESNPGHRPKVPAFKALKDESKKYKDVELTTAAIRDILLSNDEKSQ